MNAVVPSGLGFFVLVCGLVGFLGVRRVLFRFFRVVRRGAGVDCAEAEAKQRREGDGGNAVGQCAHNHIPSVGIGLDHSPPSAGGSGTSGILHFLTRVVVRTALSSAQRNITNAQPRAPPPLRPASSAVRHGRGPFPSSLFLPPTPSSLLRTTSTADYHSSVLICPDQFSEPESRRHLGVVRAESFRARHSARDQHVHTCGPSGRGPGRLSSRSIRSNPSRRPIEAWRCPPRP